MKHATPSALDHLEPLLRELGKIDGLKEKSRNVFYRGSHAFLHFHEHDDTFFGDARFDDDFERLPVTSRREQSALLRRVSLALAGAKKNVK